MLGGNCFSPSLRLSQEKQAPRVQVFCSRTLPKRRVDSPPWGVVCGGGGEGGVWLGVGFVGCFVFFFFFCANRQASFYYRVHFMWRESPMQVKHPSQLRFLAPLKSVFSDSFLFGWAANAPARTVSPEKIRPSALTLAIAICPPWVAPNKCPPSE